MRLVLWFYLCFLSLTHGAEVCFPKYGCYNNKKPFDRPLVKLPSLITPVFRLFSRASSSYSIIDDSKVRKLIASNYDGTKKTLFIIHGWIEHGEVPWINKMRAALLKREDMNVITVDWSQGSQTIYTQSAGTTRLVGVQVAEIIKFLMNNTLNSAGSYYIVGFSLGAHIAGYAGQNLKQSGYNLGRITGLDPAGLFFEAEHTAVRLDTTDATFVDVIHTDSDALGLHHAIGHVDFYPNAGANQACANILKGPFSFVTCDHFRAPEYYTESVLSRCPMRAFPCANQNDFDRGRCLRCNGHCLTMGYDVHNPSTAIYGKHYLYSNVKKPHCVYHYKVTFKTGHGWLAGINIPIQVNVVGSKGKSGVINLKRRRLSAGSIESFVIGSSAELGELKKIQVRHGGWWLIFKRWALDYVVVRAAWETQEYTACFNVRLSFAGGVRTLKKGLKQC